MDSYLHLFTIMHSLPPIQDSLGARLATLCGDISVGVD